MKRSFFSKRPSWRELTTGDDSQFLASSSSSSSSCTSSPSTRDAELSSHGFNFKLKKKNKKWRSESQMLKHFARLQCKLVAIEADGNCLFRALSDQLYGNETCHRDLRKRIVDYIESKQIEFKHFMEHQPDKCHESIAQYCKRMRRNGEWGGNPELYAAAELLCLHIVVHQGPQFWITIRCEGREPQKVLHVGYRDDHYVSIRWPLVEQESSKIFQQETKDTHVCNPEDEEHTPRHALVLRPENNQIVWSHCSNRDEGEKSLCMQEDTLMESSPSSSEVFLMPVMTDIPPLQLPAINYPMKVKFHHGTRVYS